jgi:hypothetical protein
MKHAISAGVVIGAIALTGCGGGNSSSTSKKAEHGPLTAFNTCLSKADAALSGSDANPPSNGPADIITNQLDSAGIDGNVWSYGTHHSAAANARVMTASPNIVRGKYMISINNHIGSTSASAIQSCADSIR